MSANWFEIKNINELDSPALVVFPERVKHNIQLAISMIGDAGRLRPHIKTNKSKEVTALMMQAGISKFKCATIAEAEMLAQCHAKDVLLAYQPLGPKLKRFVSLIKNYPGTKFSCLTDHADAAKEQSRVFSANNISAPVYIDLNVGMNRTGISPDKNALELYQICYSLPGIKTEGLHAYDGHIREKDFDLKKQKCDAAFDAVLSLKEMILKEGLPVNSVIVGGSPTFSVHCKRKDIECSPGTFVYWDKGYMDLCSEQKFLPAAVLVTRIISLPASGRVCTDLGHKSVASENEISKRIFFLNAENLRPVGQSEEHLVLETDADHPYKTGDVLYGLPYHICPTVALYERVHIIIDGMVSDEWKNVSRDRKIIT